MVSNFLSVFQNTSKWVLNSLLEEVANWSAKELDTKENLGGLSANWRSLIALEFTTPFSSYLKDSARPKWFWNY